MVNLVEWLPFITSFLFVFAIVYALLIYIKIFGESRNAVALISLAIAFFAAAYGPFVAILQGLIPFAALILVFLFFVVFVKKMVISEEERRDTVPTVVTLAIMLLLTGLFWDKIAYVVPLPLSPENMLWFIGIIIILLIFYAAYMHKPQKT